MFYVKIFLVCFVLLITHLYLMHYIWYIVAVFMKRIWPKMAFILRLFGL